MYRLKNLFLRRWNVLFFHLHHHVALVLLGAAVAVLPAPLTADGLGLIAQAAHAQKHNLKILFIYDFLNLFGHLPHNDKERRDKKSKTAFELIGPVFLF